MYRVEYTESAIKSLKKMDKGVALMLTNWIRKNLNECDDPYRFGKALVRDKKGFWRYRVGHYRIIAAIQEERLVIQIVDAGDRKRIYQ